VPAAVAEISPLDLEPLSPELVLVSPPELAARARLLLPQYRFATPPTAGGESSTSLGFGFVAFCLVCLASTVGPFLLAIVARAHH
jgi:hypothetical protein